MNRRAVHLEVQQQGPDESESERSKDIREIPGMAKRSAGQTSRTIWASGLTGLPMLLVPTPLWAHTTTNSKAWFEWQFTPDIVAGTLMVVAFYVSGVLRRRHRDTAVSSWRHASFFAGMLLIFLALQSPIDILSEHVFAVHQIQHFLLHSAGPMLLMLAAPQVLLTSGMPDLLRRRVLQPVMASTVARAGFGFVANPAFGTFLFVGALYFWQIPRYHNVALLDDGIHYLMHSTMLFTGIVFFFRVFDPRPAPLGTRYGVRLVMLWAATVASILIGAVVTLKESVVYGAYDRLGPSWSISALLDETVGGIIIWIPGAMMCLIAALIVIRMWGGHETRRNALAQRGLTPIVDRSDEPAVGTTGEPRVRAASRKLALGLGVIALTVFAGIIGVVLALEAIGH